MRRIGAVAATWLVLLSSGAQAQFETDVIDFGSGVDQAVAGSPGGAFVVTWSTYSFRQTVVGRRVAPDGTLLGSEFVASSTTEIYRDGSAVAMMPGGGFRVVWSEPSPGDRRIVWRRHDGNGTPIGVPRIVNEKVPGVRRYPDITINPASGIWVLWSLGSQAGNIVLRRFDLFGLTPGPELAVESGLPVYDRGSVLASLPTGETLVAWWAGGSVQQVYLQFFDAAGEPRAAPVPAGEASASVSPFPRVAGDGRDRFMVTWPAELDGVRRVRARIFGADGTAVTDEIDVATVVGEVSIMADVAMSASGDALIAWSTSRSGESAIDVQWVDPGGTLRGPRRTLARAVEGGPGVTRPRVAAGGDPDLFLVTWREAGSGHSRILGRVVRLTTCGNGLLENGEDCDDGNDVEDDCCSSACRALPFPGTCWQLAGRTTIRASARLDIRGHAVACRGRCQAISSSELFLHDDGTYRMPGGEVDCDDGTSATFPDEVGAVQARGRRLRLRASNEEALRDAYQRCGGITLRKTRTRMRIARSGDRAAGRAVTKVVQPGRPRIRVKAVTRFDAVPTGRGQTPVAPPVELAACGDELRLTCRLE